MHSKSYQRGLTFSLSHLIRVAIWPYLNYLAFLKTCFQKFQQKINISCNRCICFRLFLKMLVKFVFIYLFVNFLRTKLFSHLCLKMAYSFFDLATPHLITFVANKYSWRKNIHYIFRNDLRWLKLCESLNLWHYLN